MPDRILIDTIHKFAGEVTQDDFSKLMLQLRADSPAKVPIYCYFNGLHYFTIDPTNPTAHRLIDVDVNDIIGVEWKQPEESFLDYVARKRKVVDTKVSEPLVLGLNSEQKAKLEEMNKEMVMK